MAHRHIFLGMPGYGNQTAAAGRSYWLACKDDTDGRRCAKNEFRDKIVKEQSIGSLLACNMNRLWARALTLQHHGKRVDYFAMLHDDIGCNDFWLDKLIDELDASGLDMLGVVAPIKDCRGITSIALAHPDGDPWHVLCRLTMDEVYRLPPTFTSEDVGHPILLNTGCWVCKFDVLSSYPLYFTINDEITFDEETDTFAADCESEDWYFSRRCHEYGVKIGCTRKISLIHEGPTKYLNTYPWGRDKFDSLAVADPVIGDRKDGFVFPWDVDGWLEFIEGEAIFMLARGKRVLEIGSYCGRSTICLAQSAESVIPIDPHDGRGTPRPKETLDEFKANLTKHAVADRVRVIVGTSDQLNGEGPFDLALIDGAHKYEDVQQDIRQASSRLTEDGVLVFHDYSGQRDPEVTRAVDDLIADGGQLLSTHGTIAVVKPPAAIPLEV